MNVVINVKMQSLCTQSELFTKNLINYFAPYVVERLNKGESSIVYTENELKEILETNNYTTSNLYVRLKNDLLNFEIGVSIKRIPNNSRFTFFKRTEYVNRIIDTFKTRFDKKFKYGLVNYLDKPKNTRLGIPEKWIKERLSCENYRTDYLYSRLKKVLENTKINVTLTRKFPIKNETLNIYTFYYEKTSKNDIKEIDKDEEEFRRYITESENKEKESQIKINERINKENGKTENFVEYDNYTEYDVPMILCPICGKEKIKYPETKCSICNMQILKEWE